MAQSTWCIYFCLLEVSDGQSRNPSGSVNTAQKELAEKNLKTAKILYNKTSIGHIADKFKSFKQFSILLIIFKNHNLSIILYSRAAFI